MAIKAIERKNGCFAKAFEDEVLFVLRAKDLLAPGIVREWAKRAEQSGAHEPEKITEARRCADAMEQWWDEYYGNARVAHRRS